MSRKEELEYNVSKIVGFLKELTKGALDFFYPDDVSSPDLNINLPNESLLSGEYFCKAWDRHFSGKGKKAYGIYFIFLKNKGDKDSLIPLYVGKGWLPTRCLEHFSLTQYIDMLLAGHFGGVPRNPKLLVDDPKRQERILEASEDFAIGFLLIDQSKAKAFEDKFINCLAPLANTEVYSKFKKTPPYNIHKLILFWPDEIKKGCFEESPHKTLPDLEGLKKCHEEKLKDLN